MALGPGKYDDVATIVRTQTKAQGVVVIVFDGHLGSGFSIQVDAMVLLRLPKLLRLMADSVEADLAANLPAGLAKEPPA
jgi:hypothetical protein